MKIYVTRHGQTNLNKQSLMQGRVDEPLNEKGAEQARVVAAALENVNFDAIFSSPLERAMRTASIIGRVAKEDVIRDERITEFDFGPYERKPYGRLGLKMTLFWILPEVFHSPKGVESIPDAVNRVSSFILELRSKDYENVLIVCHGGIIRVICGILEGRKKGIKWRPKPKNCEVREYEI